MEKQSRVARRATHDVAVPWRRADSHGARSAHLRRLPRSSSSEIIPFEKEAEQHAVVGVRLAAPAGACPSNRTMRRRSVSQGRRVRPHVGCRAFGRSLLSRSGTDRGSRKGSTRWPSVGYAYRPMGLYAHRTNNPAAVRRPARCPFYPLSFDVPAFIPGLVLSERLYREVVRPMLDPDLPTPPGSLAGEAPTCSASTPRCRWTTAGDPGSSSSWTKRTSRLSRAPREPASGVRRIPDVLRHARRRPQPPRRRGSSTASRRVRPAAFFVSYLGFDPLARALLPPIGSRRPNRSFEPSPRAASSTTTLGLGLVPRATRLLSRRRLALPNGVRVGAHRPEEHLVGRAGFVGDELGASIIAARLVRDLMRLAFLMERTYAPYPKWFGTAFARLQLRPRARPAPPSVFEARGWQERDARLAPAYETVARMHNRLGLTEPSGKAEPFFNRPFSVIHLTADSPPPFVRDPRP